MSLFLVLNTPATEASFSSSANVECSLLPRPEDPVWLYVGVGMEGKEKDGRGGRGRGKCSEDQLTDRSIAAFLNGEEYSPLASISQPASLLCWLAWIRKNTF